MFYYLPSVKKTDDTPPLTIPIFDTAVSTSSGLAANSALVASVIKESGGAQITQYGHVWSKTNALPTLTDAKSQLGATTGPFPLSFTDPITGLEGNTAYYIRPYAINSVGTAYGPVLQVKTVALPALTSAPTVGLVLTRAAWVNSINVSENGGGPIIQQGFVWSKTADNPNPTVTNSKRELGPVSGTVPFSFTTIMTDLSPGIAYSVRAFATNASGTAYSPVAAFQSIAEIPNAVTDGAISIGNFAEPSLPLGTFRNATIAYGGIDLVYPTANASAEVPIVRTVNLSSGFECQFEVAGSIGQRIILQMNLPNNGGYTYLGLFTGTNATSAAAIYDFDATPTVNITGPTIFDGRLHTVRMIVRPGTNNQGMVTQIYLDGKLLYQCQNSRNPSTQLGGFKSISINAFNNPSGPGQYHFQNFSFKTL